jgi:flagellar motility protein MotE (MotC chaperone)
LRCATPCSRPAEKKLEERLGELKQAEERIVAATQQREEVELHRLKNLVTMYESMKAKDAAKIFDGLDLKLATEVAKLIQPRRMSDILAQMSPEAAQRLTVELASRPASDGHAPSKQELPKIEGRPSGS